MQEIKAENITIIDLKGILNSVSDYFVVCTGNSDTQVDSIAQSIDKMVSEGANESPMNVEGRTNREWILLDYGNVVAHIFRKDKRDFYQLEELWGDAKIINVE